MIPVVHSLPLNMGRLILFWDHHESSRYVRWIRHICLTQSSFSLVFQAIDLGSQAGLLLPLQYPKYGIEFSDGVNPGVIRGVYTRVANENRATINGTLGTEPDGPYMIKLVPLDGLGVPIATPIEQAVPFWIWIDRNGTAKDHPMVVFQNGSFDWTHDSSKNTYRWILCPKTQLKERVVPQKWANIPSKEIPANAAFPGVFPGGEPFNTAVAKEKITRLNFVPTNDPNMRGLYWPSITSRGITVTEFIQAYFSTGVIGGTPSLPLLDGPSGEGTVYGATSLHIGHAGSIYGLTPFSFFRVSRDGTVKTFAGLRHKRPPIYWEEMHARYNDPESQKNIKGVEVVGNWDPSIPPERRFPWEGWGLVVDSRTTQQDTTVPKIDVGPPFGLLPPHAGSGPVFFSTCRFGRVLKYQFSPNSFDDPTVTEFITGLSDPWGLAIEGNVLYIAERGADRISMYSADDGKRIGDLIANPNGAQFGAVGKVWRKWSPNPFYRLSSGEPNLGPLRAQNILAPEGLFVQDGFCYWGSMAQGEVRRINIATGKVEVCCRPAMSYQIQSYWVEIKLSDGTFGPRGTIFHTTFDNQFFGRPVAHLPIAGTDKDGTSCTHMNVVPYPGIPTATLDKAIWAYADYARGVLRGPGGKTDGGGYATAVGVGNGMLAYASSDGGLAVFTLATLGEALPDYAKATRGYQYFLDKGYSLLYGNHGFGHIDVPLPWGENADCDYWLQLSGHDPVGVPDCSVEQAKLNTVLAKIDAFKRALA